MATRIILPFWPTCQQNLQWSEDNLIAVAGGGSIAILVPRLDLPSSDALRWDSVVLKVDGFTQAEIPIMQPRTRQDWSIGEELAQRNVSAIRWSSAGLGMYDNCVMGVLYSDHTLALWQCKGRPEMNESWDRCYIVNETLQAYSPIPYNHRIRAFAWRPLRQSGNRRMDHHLLAAGTESGQIYILDVQSPYASTQASDHKAWNIDVLHLIEAGNQSLPSAGTTATMSPFQHFTRPAIIELTWAAGDSIEQSRVVFKSADIVAYIDILVDADHRITSFDIQELCNEKGHHILTQGPLSLIRGFSTLLTFSSDAITTVKLDNTLHNHEQRSVSSYMDTNWSEISGLGVMPLRDGSVSVQLCTHQTCHTFENAQYRLLGESLELSDTPRWQQELRQSVHAYGSEHQLGTKVRLCSHGLAVMPEGSFVAVCISMLPGDSVSHVINSSQTCTVLISDICEDQDRLTATSKDMSTLPTSSVLLETFHAAIASRTSSDQSDVEQWTSRLAHLMQGHRFGVNTVGVNVASTVEDVHGQLFTTEAMVASRARTLAQQMCSGSVKARLSEDAYRSLLATVQNLSDRCQSGGVLSEKIRKCYQSFGRISTDQDHSQQLASDHLEQCSLCQQPIEFEAVRWARCVAGHKFMRCALTLVTISQPGLSKSCLICGTQYLSELKIDDICSLLAISGKNRQQPQDIAEEVQSSHEPDYSFARLLLFACDRCLMCGGKFATL